MRSPREQAEYVYLMSIPSVLCKRKGSCNSVDSHISNTWKIFVPPAPHQFSSVRDIAFCGVAVAEISWKKRELHLLCDELFSHAESLCDCSLGVSQVITINKREISSTRVFSNVTSERVSLNTYGRWRTNASELVIGDRKEDVGACGSEKVWATSMPDHLEDVIA